MRFAEALLLAVAAATSGCALWNSPIEVPAASAPAAAPSAAPSAAAPAPTPAVAARSAAATAPVERARDIAVDPAAMRAFEDARRALAAGRTADAERGFRALAQSHPDLGGPHANLGVIHRGAGRFAESVAALEKAVVVSPDQPIYYNQLGISYREAGQFAKAKSAYERAIALDGKYAAAHLNLAILHDLYLRDAARALDGYEQYLTLTGAKDATVGKWVTDLKNRKPEKTSLAQKERP